MSPEDKAIVVPSILKLSMSIPASAVILPPDAVVPLMSTLPLISMVVPFISTSLSETKSRTPSAD